MPQPAAFDRAPESTATDGIAPELGDEENYAGRHQEDAGEVPVLAPMRQPEQIETDGNREKAEAA